MTSSRRTKPEPAAGPFDTLKRQVSSFLGDRRDFRNSVNGLVQELNGFGEAAIVGGMLRDLLLDGYRQFSSDVDFVVDTPDVAALESFLLSRGGVRNKFGGYALPSRWKVDVWPLQRTWAHVQGHRQVNELADILHTTFFNWDAILYLTGKRVVVTGPNYLAEVRERYLDLNLSSNPNPAGSLIRTLRAAARHHATLSPELTEYACRHLGSGPHSWIVRGEAAAYGRRAVLEPDGVDMAARIISAAAAKGTRSIPFPNPQMQLPVQGQTNASPLRAGYRRGGRARTTPQDSLRLDVFPVSDRPETSPGPWQRSVETRSDP